MTDFEVTSTGELERLRTRIAELSEENEYLRERLSASTCNWTLNDTFSTECGYQGITFYQEFCPYCKRRVEIED